MTRAAWQATVRATASSRSSTRPGPGRLTAYNRHALPDRTPSRYAALRHYFIGCQDASGEFLAQGMRIELTSGVYGKAAGEGLQRVNGRISFSLKGVDVESPSRGRWRMDRGGASVYRRESSGESRHHILPRDRAVLARRFHDVSDDAVRLPYCSAGKAAPAMVSATSWGSLAVSIRTSRRALDDMTRSRPSVHREFRVTIVSCERVIEYEWNSFEFHRHPGNFKDVELGLIEITDSSLVAEIMSKGRYGGGGHHLRISFDDHGTYDIVCERFTINYARSTDHDLYP